MGLAAAMTAQRACSVVTMPALEIEMLCCSMASWMDVRSWSFILSNCARGGVGGGGGWGVRTGVPPPSSDGARTSSIMHTPRSASTSAPPRGTTRS